MMKGIRGLLEKDFRLFFRQGGNLFLVLVFVALFFILTGKTAATFIAMYNLIYSRLNPDCGLNDFMILSHPKLSAENNKVDVGSGQGERVKFINSFRNYIEAITSDLLAGNPLKLWSVWLEMDISRFYPSP